MTTNMDAANANDLINENLKEAKTFVKVEVPEFDEWPVQDVEGAPSQPPVVDPTKDYRDDPSTMFAVHIPPDRLKVCQNSIKYYSVEDIRAAWSDSIWKGMQLLPEDVKFGIPSLESFMSVLPYIGSNHLRYIRDRFVCRNYASTFASICAAVLHVDGVGKTLDFKGHHSYSIVVTYNEDKLEVNGIEPQLDAVISQLDPSRHYTGTGVCIFGG